MLGAALGFGAQQVVRELIAGTFIVLERQYGYGDVVHISAVGFTEGATGTIEEVALGTTRLRTLNGEVVIVPNGQIVQVTNLSRDWARAVVDVPLPVKVDVMRASELLRKVGEEACSLPWPARRRRRRRRCLQDISEPAAGAWSRTRTGPVGNAMTSGADEPARQADGCRP